MSLRDHQLHGSVPERYDHCASESARHGRVLKIRAGRGERSGFELTHLLKPEA